MTLHWKAADRLLKCMEDYRRYQQRPGMIYLLRRKYVKLKHLVLSCITASDLDIRASIGRGLKLPHPGGVVIHPNAVVGEDCMIMQQVTIGQLASGDVPIIGNGVYVGAGAKILGKVVVGDKARIGANAVVLKDVPAGCTAVGVPARILARSMPDG